MCPLGKQCKHQTLNHSYLLYDELICEIASSYITLTYESSDRVDGHSTILLSVGVRAAPHRSRQGSTLMGAIVTGPTKTRVFGGTR